MFGNTAKFIQGDGPPGREFLNQAFDAATSAKINRIGMMSSRHDRGARDADIFDVVNTVSGALPQFGILAIDDARIPPTEQAGLNRPVFDGVAPVVNEPFVVLLQPVAEDNVALAVFSGCTWVKVNVTTEAHEFANCTTSTAQLTSGESGQARIIWKESGTGVKWAFIKLGETPVDSGGFPEEVLCSFSASGFGGNSSGVGSVSILKNNAPTVFSKSGSGLGIAINPGTFLFSVDLRFGIRTIPIQIQNSNDFMFPGSYTEFSIVLDSFGFSAEGADAFRADADNPGALTTRKAGSFAGHLTVAGNQTLGPICSVSSYQGASQNNFISWDCSGFLRVVRIT